jgi:drug/metabolite transporter (DMT)-like permease
MRVFIYTVLALIAFAGNSVLCRMALGAEEIDPTSFTVVRLLSGAFVLVLILKLGRAKNVEGARGSWKSAGMLFTYGAAFSFAYLSLDTGTGALILFGAVQFTMILIGIKLGHSLNRIEWLGVAIASVGFIYLMAPGLTTPSFLGFILMCVSGIAWGLYTLAGKNSLNPLSDTAYNFLRTSPLVFALAVIFFQYIDISVRGFILAIASGAIASGLGYTIWYMALRDLSATRAAVLQLLVPVIASAGGVVFSSEHISAQLVISSILVLGGVLLVIMAKPSSKKS